MILINFLLFDVMVVDNEGKVILLLILGIFRFVEIGVFLLGVL